jgi:hypothetical protein
MRPKSVGRFLVMSLLAAPLLAQSAVASGRGYDRAAEVAITGTVVGVDAYAAPDGAVGVHLEVNTGREFVRVVVAPAMYIGQNNFSFLTDDPVTIIGARVSHDGSTAVWARTIAKGSTMLVLRSEDGTPRWTPATDGADGCGVNHSPLVRTTDR